MHDYGDICQVITELAVQEEEPIPAHEFRTLNLCLDDAIAGAVTSYAHQRESTLEAQGLERLGVLHHDLRNALNMAVLSFEIIKGGRVAVGGSTGAVLGRSLLALRDLLDRSLPDVRLDAALHRPVLISVAELIEEIEIGAMAKARSLGLRFGAELVDRTVTVEGDRAALGAALAALLENAFGFTRSEGYVFLATRVTTDRVLFEIEDECGGLPPGKSETLSRSFQQPATDRRGLGVGLSLCLKAARANGGELRVRDVPGHGCVFTLDLLRTPPPR